MNSNRFRIDPETIFFINEKNNAVTGTTECKTCGNLIFTEENYSVQNTDKEDCPFCSTFLLKTEKESSLEYKME